MLGLEDQVVQLSVHVHKHGFNRLIWLKDLDLLLRLHGDALDWKLVRQVSRGEGVTASVWYTLQLASALLGTPLPLAVSGLCPAPIVRWLYSLVWPLARVANLQGFVRRRSVQFQAADSWRACCQAWSSWVDDPLEHACWRVSCFIVDALPHAGVGRTFSRQ